MTLSAGPDARSLTSARDSRGQPCVAPLARPGPRQPLALRLSLGARCCPWGVPGSQLCRAAPVCLSARCPGTPDIPGPPEPCSSPLSLWLFGTQAGHFLLDALADHCSCPSPASHQLTPRDHGAFSGVFSARQFALSAPGEEVSHRFAVGAEARVIEVLPAHLGGDQSGA